MKPAAFASILLTVAGVAQAATTGLTYHFPSTGVLPTAGSFEMFSYLHERHGGHSLAMQKYELNLQLSDTSRSGYRDWKFSLSLDSEITHMHAGGFDLRKRELYNFALPCTVIHRFKSGNSMIAALAPTLATDFVKWNRAWCLNGMFQYKIKSSEHFSYGFGVVLAPRMFSWCVIPAFSCEWTPNENWRLKLGGGKLAVMRNLGSGWSAGLFAAGSGGSWAVATDDGDTRIFRVRSLVAGATVEWDFSREGQSRRVLSTSVGMPVVTTAEFCRFNANKKTLGKHHYGTGVYAAAALDFRF